MNFRTLPVLTLLLLFAASVSPAAAQNTVTVGPNGPYFSLGSAVSAAGPNGTVRIRSGRYAASDLRIPYDLTMIGEGNVTIFSNGRVSKGLLLPLRGVSLEVRGITFENARSRDDNGAGIRVEGNELIVRNCTFRNNENGILATGSDGGEITITGSTFLNNGYGDGYSHGIYVSSAAKLEISNSRFEGTKIGHHVKSIAGDITIVRNTTFDDQAGRTSYMIDVTGGGDLLVEGNTMLRAASAEQATLINYDISRGGERGSITIEGNQVVNRKRGAKLLRNPTNAPVYLDGNGFINEAGGTLDLPVSTPGLYEFEPTSRFPVVEQKSIEEQAALDNLTPAQRRAVEELVAQGQSLQSVEPAVVLASELVDRTDNARSAPRQATAQILLPPEFAEVNRPAEVVGLNLTRNGAARATSKIVTFAQAFEKGALAPNDGVALKTGGSLLPAQMDIKATHKDGSVRHALLTLNTSSLATASLHQGVLVKMQPATDTAALAPDLATYNLVVAVTGTTADGTRFSGSVDLNQLTAEAIAARRYWMNGPYATEVSVHQDIGPFLTVRADIRFLRDGAVRTRLTFENHKTFAIGNRDLSYDIVLQDRDRPVLQRNGIAHYRGANWTEVIWKGRRPAYDVQLDPAYLIRAGAVPPFDLSFGVRQSAIKENADGLISLANLFSAGLVTKYFPTSGGRAETGLLPDWDVHWLKTQQAQARQTMISMAEQAGAIPWHFEEYGTSTPVRVDQRPKFWAEQRGESDQFAPDNIPAGYFDGNDGGWTLDSAHKPLLSYTAYLATGDAHFARELAHEGAFSIAQIWPELRQGKALVTEAIQVRSRAWALRDVSNAAWLLPDQNPMKAYFQSSLAANLAHLYDSYIVEDRMAAAGETKGWFAENVNGEPARISPWQNDYMVMVLGQEATRGAPVAVEIMAWAAGYHTGRFLAAGVDPALGAVAVHAAKDSQSGEPVGDWSTLMQRTREESSAAESYPRDGDGYVASAYAALASIYSATGSDRAIAAIKALAAAQEDDLLFDPDNDDGVYAVSNYLLSTRGPDGRWVSVTELLE